MGQLRGEAFLMSGVPDGGTVRDEQPTRLPPHPSLHQETTGALRVKNELYKFSCDKSIVKQNSELQTIIPAPMTSAHQPLRHHLQSPVQRWAPRPEEFES
jgi:hypothetical protein